MSTYSLAAIPAFNDNYIWCLHRDQQAVVVDPGDASPVLAFCQHHQLTLVAILITHHHADHTGGIEALKRAYPHAQVWGPKNERIAAIDHRLTEGQACVIDALALEFSVFEVPGHTLDHIAYYCAPWLFCGDTLFSAGCGRLFEGTATQMCASLQKLRSLPDDTLICCAHEYTEANLNFARHVEPDNLALQAYSQRVAHTRAQHLPSLPASLATEKAINPFLRWDAPSVVQAALDRAQQARLDHAEVFATIRSWKDTF